MLGEVYFDTYKRYKAGTDKILKWLTETAGYILGSGSGTRTGSKTDSLSVNDYPLLADQIAKAVPPPTIPSHILTTLEPVISARQECAAHHRQISKNAGTPEDWSDRAHDHFLGLLEKVYRTLQHLSAAIEPFPRRVAIPERRHNANVSLTNRFEYLDVLESAMPAAEEEIVQQPPSAGKVKSAGGRQKEGKSTNARASDEESVFACFCFIKDWYAIREVLKDLWSQYRETRVSLTTAAITSNMAIDSIERLHRALLETFPAFDTFTTIDDLILADPTMEDSTSGEVLPNDMRFGWEMEARYEFQSPLPGREVYSMLQHFAEAHRQGIFREFPVEENGVRWVRECREKTPPRTQLRIMDILVRLIPDMIAFMCHLDDDGAPVDQLSSHVFAFYNSHKVTVSLVFACEIFLDVMFVLEGDVERAFGELQEAASAATASMRKYAIYTKALSCDSADAQINTHIETLAVAIKMLVSEDAVMEFRREHIRPLREGLTPHCLLKHHPILCGMLRFHIDRSLYYIGLCMCNE